MRSVIRPCSKISSSIPRLLLGFLLAGLSAITLIFPVVTVAAQIAARSSSLLNPSSSTLPSSRQRSDRAYTFKPRFARNGKTAPSSHREKKFLIARVRTGRDF